MGEGLADNRPEGEANGQEWRTVPVGSWPHTSSKWSQLLLTRWAGAQPAGGDSLTRGRGRKAARRSDEAFKKETRTADPFCRVLVNRFLMKTLGRIATCVLRIYAAASSAETQPQHILRVADEHILPAFQARAQTTAALSKQATVFCEQPDAAALQGLHERFHGAMDAWQSIQHIRFGPVGTLMRSYRYQFWPDKRGTVGKHLRRLLAAEDENALKPERFASASVAIQGFSADVSTSDFSVGEQGRYRCAVVQVIIDNLGVRHSTWMNAAYIPTLAG